MRLTQVEGTRLRRRLSVALKGSPGFANGVVGCKTPGQLNNSLGVQMERT